jgi:SAM-dependent methyltransferase
MRADPLPPAEDGPIDIDRLMREIRADIAARLPENGSADFRESDREPGRVRDAIDAGQPLRLSRIGAFAAPLAKKDAYRLDDFLGYHDDEFVRNAYRALLGREPDAEGASRYLAKLRSGELSKIEVLGRIRLSPEGKAAAVTVDGLLVPFGMRTARRIPLIGRLLGIIQYLWRLPDLARHHEMLESALFANRSEARVKLNGIVAEIEQALVDVRNALTSRIEATVTETRSIRDALTSRIDATVIETRSIIERKFGELQTQLLAIRANDEVREATILRLADGLSTLAMDVARGARGLDALRDGNQVLGQRLAQIGAISELDTLVASAERAAGDLRQIARANPTPDSASAHEVSMSEGFYVAFEDRFRGTRDDIKERARVYLPLVRAAGAGSADALILDIGCGRGEWLELLQEQGLTASGIDVNDVAVAGCLARGLVALKADGIDHLTQLAPNSLGAVSAIHVIEHLPFARMIELFDEAHRVLRPGGVVICETPNPENLVVGACNFYYDPTHDRPLPPEPFRFILESRGFERVEIMRLHCDSRVPQLGGVPEDLAQVLMQRLFGPQDYALIGFKRR